MDHFQKSKAFMESPSVLERYWFARALSASRSPESFSNLVRLADDPHPNVRCQAFFALGASENPAAIPAITGRMQVSQDWYVQFYGYMALKRLGWNQQK
jgi:HEAT repeat protein